MSVVATSVNKTEAELFFRASLQTSQRGGGKSEGRTYEDEGIGWKELQSKAGEENGGEEREEGGLRKEM